MRAIHVSNFGSKSHSGTLISSDKSRLVCEVCAQKFETQTVLKVIDQMGHKDSRVFKVLEHISL